MGYSRHIRPGQREAAPLLAEVRRLQIESPMATVADPSHPRTGRRVPFTHASRLAHERADRAAADLLATLSIYQDGLSRGDRYKARYELNGVQRLYSLRQGIRRCFQGGRRCESALCAVCSTARASQNRRSLLDSLTTAQHGTVLLWTPTIAGEPGEGLRSHWSALVEVMQATTAGGWLKRRGVSGTARAIEVEHTAAGWHPHGHILICFPKRLTRDEAREFALILRDRWIVKAAELDRHASPQGQHVALIGDSDLHRAARYITKSRIRANAADTPSSLWSSVRDGDADALSLVHELEAGSFRRRTWTTTGTCRPVLDLDDLLASGAF